VIRLCLALATKIFLALITPHSVLAEMYGGLLGDRLSHIILSLVVYLALDNLHIVSATTVDQIWIQ
jgi:hypothetical protein